MSPHTSGLGIAQLQWRTVGGCGLSCGQVVGGDQTVQNVALALLGKGEVSHRIVGRRGLHKTCEHRCLSPAQASGTEPEIAASRSYVTPVAVPVVVGVEVHAENLRSRVAH